MVAVAITAEKIMQTTDKKIEAELISLVRARSIALVQGDANFFKRLLADDFSYTNANGVMLDKAAYLEFYIESKVIQWQAQDIDDLWIRRYGDVVVLTCRIYDRTLFEGNAQEAYFRSTQIFVKQAEVWRYVAGQTTATEAI